MRRLGRPEQRAAPRQLDFGAYTVARTRAAAPAYVMDLAKDWRAEMVECWPWAALVTGALLCTIALMAL
jgi:hypothetical protein